MLASFPCKACAHSGICNYEITSDFDIPIPKQAALPPWFRIKFDCVHYEPRIIEFSDEFQ